MLTSKQFKELFPKCVDTDGWVKAMVEVLPKYGIDTPKRIASFVAQCSHETAGWRVFEENLNYNADGLNDTFPKYFVKAGRNAKDYANQPERIANLVYSGRMGNTLTGDGFKYRGRGPIQLTGKLNYLAFSKDMNVDVSNPDIVIADKKISLMSAVWFWNKNGLNKFADAGDIIGMTKVINGGLNGIEDRIMQYDRALKMLLQPSQPFQLRKGDKNAYVKEIQHALKIQADGEFGPETEAKLKEYQTKNGLLCTGICTREIFKKLTGKDV